VRGDATGRSDAVEDDGGGMLRYVRSWVVWLVPTHATCAVYAEHGTYGSSLRRLFRSFLVWRDAQYNDTHGHVHR
jgi:hypothetical protein